MDDGVSVTPQVPRLEPWEDENFKDEFDYECDLCWHFGDDTTKRVKWKFGVICCKPCFLSMKEIKR